MLEHLGTWVTAVFMNFICFIRIICFKNQLIEMYLNFNPTAMFSLDCFAVPPFNG